MPTPREELADLLRQSRVDAGYKSHGAFAHKLNVSRSLISKAESATQPVPPDTTLEAWADATGADLTRLKKLAQQARSGNPEWFMPYEHEESKADSIRCWSPSQIPGLLQAESYARETLSVDRYTPERLAELVKARMARKEALERSSITAIIDEHALRRWIGSPAVMAEQCGYIVSLVAERPNIALHVIPERVNIGLGGGFSMATRGGMTIVALTTAVRDITSTAEYVVAEVLQRFERLLGAALPCGESVECVRAMEEKWKEQSI